jgi:hypothetical protein
VCVCVAAALFISMATNKDILFLEKRKKAILSGVKVKLGGGEGGEGV